ncbi:MAG TPA: hypothetical protein VMY05_08080 [Acidobacteriota bacterium]|nr:hypothetical protein [Acidobacteriota bacterium]
MDSARRITAAISAVILLSSVSVLAVLPYAPKSKGLVGIRAGIIGRATIDYGAERNLQSMIDLSLGLFWEVPFTRHAYSGIWIDGHNIEAAGQQQFLLDVSLPVAYAYEFPRARMLLRPVIAFGLGHLANITFMDATSYLTIKVLVQLHFLLPKQRAWIIELGVFHAPVGGNSKLDVSIGPAVLLRLGYVL